MPANPQMRASDDDRDRAAALLREHHAAGRLTVEEFHERLDIQCIRRRVWRNESLPNELVMCPAGAFKPTFCLFDSLTFCFSLLFCQCLPPNFNCRPIGAVDTRFR